MRVIPNDNLSYPVLVKLSNGVTGSGFFLMREDQSFFVTANHVLQSQQPDGRWSPSSPTANLVAYYHTQSGSSRYDVDINFQNADLRFDHLNDVAVVRLGSSSTDSGRNILTSGPGIRLNTPPGTKLVGVRSENLLTYDNVLISNDVFVFGYPNSLSLRGDPHIDFERPLLRKGIVAGKHEAKRTIILDCPVYYGNSGGMALQVEQYELGAYRFNVIGVVTAFVPFIEELKSVQIGYVNVNVENSGYSIVAPADIILSLSQ